ncbi:hypothetical protein F8M41_023187 [Gigaspora margarita]|uniref:Uncharacterized protein n=1 Tax=Gigaspora margarita TaxID=4874 RepID=A0A8H4ADT3_GIGMA|nr:hypothetical protein F8M41_023187 [Gigaspora margarita]
MNLKPIPWHVHGMNQDLVPLKPVNLVIQKAIQKYMKSIPQKKITYSNTKRSKKHKSAKPRSERSLLRNKTSSKKSSASSDKRAAFFAILRSMVDSFTYTQPKKVSINGYNMINAEFIALKDPVLNHFTSNFSDKE